MCGIAGFVGRGEIDVAPRLDAMTDALRHRGPDDRGLATTSSAGIAMQRLSIVGIETGSQPIFSEDRQLAIVGNGEIYNAPELREGLESRGHRFRGGSDIESVLHLFEERGTDAFSELNGMFGIAIWDRSTNRVVLARDRVGIKPVFYGEFPSGIAFASELPALLAGLSSEERRAIEVDPARIHEVLRHGYVSSPGTIYRGVHRLPAGHWVSLDRDGASAPRAWWTLPEYTPETRSLEDFAEEAEALLRESVQLRTLGDVPPGAFLSGGLDSGTVVSILTESLGYGVPCFTIAFDDAGLDEAEDAARTAREFGCPHHVERLDSVGIDELDQLFSQFGEPFADVSLLPTHRVSKLAAGHVKYVLSGDGGDELFAGYAWLTREVQLRRLPSALRGTARILGPILRHGQRATGSGLFGKALRTVGDLASSSTDSFLRRRSLGSPALLRDFAGPALAETLPRTTPLERFAADAPIGWETLLDLDRRFYLPGDILEKVDRATMAHSLEARVPFLDHRLVELAARIPIETHLGPDGRGKAVLRRVISRVLPPALLRRPKRGFGIPVDRWLAGSLAEPLRERLLDPSFLSRGWVRADGVERLIEAHRSGRARHGHLLWALLSLACWSPASVTVAPPAPALA